MQNVERSTRGKIDFLVKISPVISFIIPIFMLYSLYSYSFDQTYQGRMFHLFFLWLIFLEVILNWEKLEKRVDKVKSKRTLLFILTLILPTLYVTVANYYGLNLTMTDLARQQIFSEDPLKDIHASAIPLSIEFLVFAVLFCLIILLMCDIDILMDFSLPIFFSGSIGMLFMIDNLYPYGRFAPLQTLVPTTATLAANVLNLMGYETTMTMGTHPIYGSTPYIKVTHFPRAGFGIAWPCSGVESFLIYTITILLFLKKADIPLKHKIIYFAVGAMVTYSINVLRVVKLFTIAIGKGQSFTVNDIDWQRFHNYYGMLYSTAWILCYPLIIIGSRALWETLKGKNKTTLILTSAEKLQNPMFDT